MALMVSVSGIRGIFGTDLTPENLVTYAAAYGTWLNGGTVVLGRDSRVTGQICEDIVTATLQSVGCDVIKTGIAPTPTVAMAVLRHKARGGIILTASHNPAEWNALKLLNEKSEFLDAGQGEEVLAIAEEGSFDYKAYNRIGTLTHDSNAVKHHIRAILDLPFIDRDQIAKAGLRVAIDAVNGAGSVALPLLLETLGVKVFPLHCKPDGLFPHNPEPLPENLTDIRNFMKQNPCDLGLVTDPDADRLALVDENGNLFGEEYTQVAAFDFILSKQPGAAVTNLSSSRAAEDIVKSHGQVCHRSAVGEINVVKKMHETGAVIGGEGNGGVIHPGLHYGRDALAGSALILQLLAEKRMTVSQYRNTLPDYRIVKERISLDKLGMGADEVLMKLTRAFPEMKPNTTDGVKFDFEEGWVHFRKSNTEPIVRIYAEAETTELAKELAQRVIGKIT